MIVRKLYGRLHDQVLPADVQVGDVIAYLDHGVRWGRVDRVHRGRVHRWVRVEAQRYRGSVLAGARRVEWEFIVSAWRRKARKGAAA